MARRTLILLALLVLPAYVAVSAGFRYSAMVETEGIRNLTETKLFKHTISDGYDGTRFFIKMKLTAGQATVRLRDAKNVERWAKTFRKGEAFAEQSYPGVTGEWRVEVTFKEASGKYTVKLEDF